MVDPNIPFSAVHASRGKVVRAEPAARLHEQDRVHHVGMSPELEDQMCGFTPILIDSGGLFARSHRCFGVGPQ
jgi:phage terminase large subunit-like protein